MEKTEYIIISDRERKDFNCPGYIQKKTFEEILDEAAKKADEEYKELPPDPLEHP